MRSYLLSLLFLSLFLTGCEPISTAMTGSTIHSIYGTVVDERGLYTMAKDKRIKLEIQAKIADEAFSNLVDVGVESFYGKVYLIGEYESYKERARLIALAKNTDGVRQVITHLLRVKKNDTCSTTDNVALLANVKARLFDDAKVWGTDIHVHTVQCHVILAGVVRTKMERSRAISVAKKAGGRRSVVSYIRALQ